VADPLEQDPLPSPTEGLGVVDPFAQDDTGDSAQHAQLAAQVLKAAEDQASKMVGHPGARGTLLPIGIPAGGFKSEPWTMERLWERSAVPNAIYGPFKSFNDIIQHVERGGDIMDPAVVDEASSIAASIMGGTAFKKASQEGLAALRESLAMNVEHYNPARGTNPVVPVTMHPLPPHPEEAAMRQELEGLMGPKIEDKPIPEAKPATSGQDPLGFTSKAEEVAQAWPQTTGTPQQAIKYLKENGVKNAEMKALDMDSLKGQGKISRDDLVKHIQENRTVLQETQYGGIDEKTMARELVLHVSDLADQGRVSPDVYHEVMDAARYIRSGELTFSELQRHEFQHPEAYDVVNSFMGLARRHTGMGKDGPPQYSEYSLGKGHDDTYKETVLSLPGPEKFKHSHWEGISNPVLHMRTSEEVAAHGDARVLQLQEMQSDWGQRGRVRDRIGRVSGLPTGEKIGGFRDETKMPALEKAYADAVQLVDDTRAKYKEWNDRDFTNVHDVLASLVGTFGSGGESLLQAVQNETRNPHYFPDTRAVKQTLRKAEEEIKSGRELPFEDVFKAHEIKDKASRALSQEQYKVQHHPTVETTDRWTNIGLRRLLRQAVEQDVDAVSLPTAKLIDKLGMGGQEEGHKGFYEKILPKNLGNILKELDPSIQPETTMLPRHPDVGPVTMFRLTPMAREKIAKGQRLYSEGTPSPLTPQKQSENDDGR